MIKKYPLKMQKFYGKPYICRETKIVIKPY